MFTPGRTRVVFYALMALASTPGITWRVITPAKPILWPRTKDETWALNPPLKYIVTSDVQAATDGMLESWSDLRGSSLHRPVNAMAPLAGKSILVERHRDRGIGDLLFMTGPLAYLQHINHGQLKIYWYADAVKGQVAHGLDTIANKVTLNGPVIYDTLGQYSGGHWFVEAATEYTEEPDQLNVYDALLVQLGLDHTSVPDVWKRPRVGKVESDDRRFREACALIQSEHGVCLARSSYSVVAPFANSSLRVLPYRHWIKVIAALAERGPVIVLGQLNSRMPVAGITAQQFVAQLKDQFAHKPHIIPILGESPMRTSMALIAKAARFVGLDSGLLYIAQGYGVPAVSIWGPQDPRTRIGYDKSYMDLAIWDSKSCPHCPCFAYREFPDHKCPDGAAQLMCSVLSKADPDQIVDMTKRI